MSVAYILSLAPSLAVQCIVVISIFVALSALFSAAFAAPCSLAGLIRLALESVRDLANALLRGDLLRDLFDEYALEVMNKSGIGPNHDIWNQKDSQDLRSSN